MLKLTVCITTYNLEKYVKQALDSVLMQQTNFDYKIVVADDFSKDGTKQILENYKNKYPDVIELILNEKNLGSLANSNQIFSNVKSEYFIFLDGDDYWINPDMLQKMVDYLDANKDYVMVGGNTFYLKQGEYFGTVVSKNQVNKSYSFEDYTTNKIPFVHTSALMIRNIIFSSGLPQCYKDAVNTFENCALRGEDFRRLIHLQKGKLFVMDEMFSVYRIHDKGMWQGASDLKRRIEAAISFNFYAKYFGNGYDSFFIKMKEKSYSHLITSLVSDYSLVRGNCLPEKESKLLYDYLDDVRDSDIKHYGKIRKLLIKTFMRFFA